MADGLDKHNAYWEGYAGAHRPGSWNDPDYLAGQAQRAREDAEWRERQAEANSSHAGHATYSGPRDSRGARLMMLIVLLVLTAPWFPHFALTALFALLAAPALYLLARFDRSHRWELREVFGPVVAALLAFTTLQVLLVLLLRAYPDLLGASGPGRSLTRVADAFGRWSDIHLPAWGSVRRPTVSSAAAALGPVTLTLGVLALHLLPLLGAAWVLRWRLRRVAPVRYAHALGGLLGSMAGGAAFAGVAAFAISRFDPPAAASKPAVRREAARPAPGTRADTDEWTVLNAKRAERRVAVPEIALGAWEGIFGPATPNASLVIQRTDSGAFAELASPRSRVTFRVEALDDWRSMRAVSGSDVFVRTGSLLLVPVSASGADGGPAHEWEKEFADYWRGSALVEVSEYPTHVLLRGASPMRATDRSMIFYSINMSRR